MVMKMILRCSCIQNCLRLRFWRKAHDFLDYLTPLRLLSISLRFGKFAVFPESFQLEAGNRRKSPVTLAVTAGYFYSFKKLMRENLSSISNTTYSACIYSSACLRLQIFTNKHFYIHQT
jgi:hypothetical protein